MTESHSDYWARRANEHARLAMQATHRAVAYAHHTISRIYRQRADEQRADEWKEAS